MPLDVERRVGLGRDRRRKDDARRRRVNADGDRLGGRRPATASAASAPAEGGRVEVDGVAVHRQFRDDKSLGVLGGHRRAARDVAAEDVLVEPHLDRRQRGIARVVQLDRLAAGERRRRRVEARRDGVVHPGLPIVAPGPAGRIASAVGEGAANHVGERDVATDRALGRPRRALRVLRVLRVLRAERGCRTTDGQRRKTRRTRGESSRLLSGRNVRQVHAYGASGVTRELPACFGPNSYSFGGSAPRRFLTK